MDAVRAAGDTLMLKIRSHGIQWLVVFAGLIGFADRAEAQQVCYAYDSMGRLSGVIDGSNNGAFYRYDGVGNIDAIERKSPSGPVTIYSIDLSSGTPGERFEIFGVGFSATAAQNQVTIGGVTAPVVSTIPCTLVVEIPAGAISGTIRVVTPSGEATATDPFSVLRFAIEGTAVSVLLNSAVQYTVTSNGCSNPSVTWRVSGFVGGNAVLGTIDVTGLYRSPTAIPTPSFVTIRAESVGCPNLFAEKTLNIVREFTSFVIATASASRGAVPATFPARVVLHSASARHGSPEPVLLPGSVIAGASAANVATITGLSPNTRGRGSSFVLTVSGVNLSGAGGLTFLGVSTPDATITVTGVSVNADGTLLTATVSISATTVVGTRIVRVDRAAGNSTAVNTGVNLFTITQ